DFGHSEIVFVGIRCAGSDGVEADRCGVKAAILRKEAFGKTVPTESRFVDDGRRNCGNVGERNQLHASGSRGVVVGKQATADKCKRKALVAVADVVAAAEKVVRIKAVVDLDDGAVHAVRKGRSEGDVAATVVVAVGRARRWAWPNEIGLGKH